MNLELVGKMAELQDDLTPFQIGTTGMFGKDKFEFVGRLRVSYDDGFWNEWYAIFGDGREGWLAEAQGFYGFCLPVLNWEAPNSSQVRCGLPITISVAGDFVVEFLHRVHCIYSEGELPMNAVEGRQSLSVDLSDGEGRMATIEYASSETRVFAGKYLDFDEFKFQNLRQIDGW
jgi:hypothetical protein